MNQLTENPIMIYRLEFDQAQSNFKCNSPKN